MAKTKFLLPCSCGREIPVEITKAGQQLQCACGAILEVPTLQGLRTLKRAAPDVAASRKSTWGLRQQLLLVGAVITVIALIPAGYLYLYRPQMLDIDTVSPWHAWNIWLDLRLGLREGMREIAQFDAMVAAYWRWMGVLGVLATLGLLTMASSLLVPQKKRKSRQQAQAMVRGQVGCAG